MGLWTVAVSDAGMLSLAELVPRRFIDWCLCTGAGKVVPPIGYSCFSELELEKWDEGEE